MNASENVSNIDITPPQMRAARALLGWTLDDLSDASRLPKRTLTRVENATVEPRASTLAAIRTALVTAGVIFVDENGEGPGVRLKKVRPAGTEAAGNK